MKLETMSLDLFQRLWRLWQQEAMSDEFRGPDPFQFMLCESDDVPWYMVDGTVFVLHKIRPNWDAQLLSLNIHHAKRKESREELGNIMDEYGLHHLVTSIPQPVRRTTRAFHRLGFKMEGRIRDATSFNGQLEDLDILGIKPEDLQDAS